MNLARREKTLFLVAGSVIGLLVFDRLLLTPYLNRKEKLLQEKNNLLQEWRQLQKIHSLEKQLASEWSNLSKNGLGSDEASTALAILTSVRSSAEDSQISLDSLKPERGIPYERWKQLSFQITGSGSMERITRFLWHLENSSLPLKITDLRLASRKEGTDDLLLQLKLTVLSEEQASKQPAGSSVKIKEETE